MLVSLMLTLLMVNDLSTIIGLLETNHCYFEFSNGNYVGLDGSLLCKVSNICRTSALRACTIHSFLHTR